MKSNEYLEEINTQEKEFASLYKATAQNFGLTECAMWLLYFVSKSEKPLMQLDIAQQTMYPKQTVNSAVAKLVADGLVELKTTAENKKNKYMFLTERGKSLAQDTVEKMYIAETKAVKSLGRDKMNEYIRLHNEFIAALQSEFEKEGLLNG